MYKQTAAKPSLTNRQAIQQASRRKQWAFMVQFGKNAAQKVGCNSAYNFSTIEGE